MPKEQWKLSEQLEPWREFIRGNGQTLEVMMNPCALIQVNAPLALIQSQVEGQEALLKRLLQEGLLVAPPFIPRSAEEVDPKAVIIKVGGKPWRCTCGANVLTKTHVKDDKEYYTCNGCGTRYEGQ